MFVLSVPPQTVHRYRCRRPDFVANEPWRTMLRPSFPRLSHPGSAQALPSIAFIAQVDRGETRGFAHDLGGGGDRSTANGASTAVAVQEADNVDVVIYDVARDTPTRLTFDSGRDDFPAWTPDGQRVVFASNRGEGFDLYWKAADGTGEVERLTTSPNLHAPSSWASGARRRQATRRWCGSWR